MPTISQWWKDQSALERSKNTVDPSPKGSLPPASPKLSGLSVPFPRTGGYYQVSFDALAGFPSETPSFGNSPADSRLKGKSAEKKMPDSIRALDGQKISVAGFMIPMLTDKEKVLSFILAQSRMTCCYGVTPKLNQWIYVKMDTGKATEFLMDIPITVSGTFSVGTEFDQENKGWCLYRMTSDKVETPKKSWF